MTARRRRSRFHLSLSDRLPCAGGLSYRRKLGGPSWALTPAHTCWVDCGSGFADAISPIPVSTYPCPKRPLDNHLAQIVDDSCERSTASHAPRCRGVPLHQCEEPGADRPL